MRAKIVFGLLLSLFIGIAVIIVVRTPGLGFTDAVVAKDAGADAAAPAEDAGADGAAPKKGDAGLPSMIGRPLRVVGYGWELVAPGLIANAGVQPGPSSEFAAAQLPITLKSAPTMQSLESALARGGSDPEGADIAIMPLPLFVAAYERLRALEPEIFFVVGWSRGRQAILSTGETVSGFAETGEVPILVETGDMALFLGLFSLEMAGVEPGRVRQMTLKTPKSEDIEFAAIDRLVASEALDKARRKLLYTTADARRLVPLVAVAQRSMLANNAAALDIWTRVWIDGQAMLRADVTIAARQVSANEGSPEPISLLTRLGLIEDASLSENAELYGLSGRGAVTLDTLFLETWKIWRAAGVLATPPPAVAPINTLVVAPLVRGADASLMQPDSRRDTSTTVDPDKGPPSGTVPVLVRREPEAKDAEENLMRSIGLLAGVFERSPVRVTVAKGATARVLDAAADRFGIRRSRLIVGSASVAKSAGVIEVLPVQ